MVLDVKPLSRRSPVGTGGLVIGATFLIVALWEAAGRSVDPAHRFDFESVHRRATG